MYLLELVHGELILREFQEENVPPYAVLSQMNEDENDEVSFNDILENTGQGKAGYAIIRLCAEAAAVNNLKWSTSEVTFQDVILGRAIERNGYQKIMGCCKQALRDGIKYLWVDTCCIDKTSSAELQEAICSMYKW